MYFAVCFPCVARLFEVAVKFQHVIDLLDRLLTQHNAEDEANRGNIEAKNSSDNYCFTMRITLQEEKLKDKLEIGDKEAIEKKVQDAVDWPDQNQLVDNDEFEAKRKELEGVENPIMMKAYRYQAAGGDGSGMPGGGMPDFGGCAAPGLP